MNRQRLDSPLVYVGAHNVYYVKLTVKVLYFTIHIHTQINQYVVISEFIKSNKLLVVYLNVEQAGAGDPCWRCYLLSGGR